MENNNVVWLSEYRRFAFLIEIGAYHSLVLMYNDNGEPEQVAVENDEYELWEERATEFESE